MPINPFGYPPGVWQHAKSEARPAMVASAAAEGTISYSELAGRIAAIPLEPRDPRLDQVLCEISTEEHQAGRGCCRSSSFIRPATKRRDPASSNWLYR